MGGGGEGWRERGRNEREGVREQAGVNERMNERRGRSE